MKKVLNTLLLFDDCKIKPLHIILPKTSVHVKSFNGQTKFMYFLIEDDDLLDKYNPVSEKVSSDIKKEFDSEPDCDNFFMETKRKSCSDEATNFRTKEAPKVGSNSDCLAVISMDSAL